MSRYAALVGKRVEARYRAASVAHHVRGRLASDNGSSICIEERFSQDGRDKSMRVEIPYEFIVSVTELHPEEPQQPSA
jgi:hypothetical protein